MTVCLCGHCYAWMSSENKAAFPFRVIQKASKKWYFIEHMPITWQMNVTLRSFLGFCSNAPLNREFHTARRWRCVISKGKHTSTFTLVPLTWSFTPFSTCVHQYQSVALPNGTWWHILYKTLTVSIKIRIQFRIDSIISEYSCIPSQLVVKQ